MDKEKKEKESIIEGGPDVEKDEERVEIVKTDLGGELKKLTELQEQLKQDRETFEKEREEFRKDWDAKIEEIESLRDLTETPEEEDTEEEVEAETEAEEVSGEDIYKKVTGEKTEEEKEEIPPEFIEELRGELGIKEPVPSPKVHPEVLEQLENIEVRLAETELRDELEEALIKYPKMDRDEVLLSIERDPSQKVLDLAKTSHEKWEGKEKGLRETVESQLKEEAELKSPTSFPGKEPGAPSPGVDEAHKASEDIWGVARKGAKEDLGIR